LNPCKKHATRVEVGFLFPVENQTEKRKDSLLLFRISISVHFSRNLPSQGTPQRWSMLTSPRCGGNRECFIEEDVSYPAGRELQYPTYGKENLSSQIMLGDTFVPRNGSGS